MWKIRIKRGKNLLVDAVAKIMVSMRRVLDNKNNSV